MIYKVQLSQYIRQYANIYVECKTPDDAVITAIEAIAWTDPEWTTDNEYVPESGTPFVVGPTTDDVSHVQVYKRKK